MYRYYTQMEKKLINAEERAFKAAIP